MAVKDLQSKLDALATGNKSNWEEKATHLIENDYWLKHSRRIAVRINLFLKSSGMQKQELATLLNVSPQQVSKIIKGRENLTLQTISKIEKALGISLLGLDSNKDKKNNVNLKTKFTYTQLTPKCDFYKKKPVKVVVVNFINNQNLMQMSF